MTKYSFHYSPFNKGGEYNFGFKPDKSDDYLKYKFSYAGNKGKLQYRFSYKVYGDMYIEEGNIMETNKETSVAESIIKLNSTKNFYKESGDYFLEDYTHRVSNLLVEEREKKYRRKRNIEHHDIISESDGSNIDYQDDRSKRLHDIINESNNQNKFSLKTGNNKRVFDLSNEDEENKFRDNRVQEFYKEKIVTQTEKIYKHDVKVIHGLKDVIKSSPKGIEMVKDQDVWTEKTNKHINMEDKVRYLITDKDLAIEEDILLKINKELKVEDEVRIDRLIKGDLVIDQAKESPYKRESYDAIIENAYGSFDKESDKSINNIDESKHLNKSIQKELKSIASLSTIDKISKSDIESIEDSYKLNKTSVSSISVEEGTTLEKSSKDIQNEYEATIEKSSENISIEKDLLMKKQSKDINREEGTNLGVVSRDIESEDKDEGQSLHKRLWFLQHHGKIDYKVLPNTDFDYPINMEILENPDICGVYKYEYTSYFTEVDGDYDVVAYDEDFNFIGRHKFHLYESYQGTVEGIEINATMLSYSPDRHQIDFKICIHHDSVSYFIIRQPKDVYGNFFSFAVGEKILSENHPIPIGDDLGTREIPVAINIMVDFVNMVLLMWSKFYPRFVGYQGVQAIDGMVKTVYEWATLETSMENTAIEDYHRCYRWFRWECEKVRNKAKYDPDLSGNLWVEEVIFELVDYMEMHHFNIIPEWYDIGSMDEHRNNIFTEVDFDIPIILDKVKGIRKRVLRSRKIRETE